MQVLKDDIRERILAAARRLFLQQGYRKTSMREIAEETNVGPGNIYNYFTNKDELFRHIVRPALAAFEQMLQRRRGKPETDLTESVAEGYFLNTLSAYKELLKEHRDLAVILLFQAQGSSLEHFREEFTDRATLLVKEWFDANGSGRRETPGGVPDFFIHLHTVWMFSLFEEMLMHNITPEQMEPIVEAYIRFGTAGWRCLMEP